ncbi:hypothetical protein GIB67_028961, partial [Kingdonia uniflora]
FFHLVSRVGTNIISWLSDVSECTWSDYSWTDTEQVSRFLTPCSKYQAQVISMSFLR